MPVTRDNHSVGLQVTSGYGLDGRVSIPGRGKIFLVSITSIPALGPTQAPAQWVPGTPSSEINSVLLEAVTKQRLVKID
jgi:hypothetical protein